jgi:GntR family transcriptional regulator/MocR family aminotransferase
MPVQWSGLSPEVLLALDRRAAEPLRSQLENQLRHAIRSGRLGIGERLPSSRELARELGLSRGLVQDCYAQLLAEGYLSTRVGSATRVSAGAASPAAAAAGAVTGTARVAAGPALARLAVDFASGVPDLASFPRADWAWAMREACRTAPNVALGYGDPRGSLQLREVLAAYLRRVRAAAVTSERIVICTGFAQGLNLVLGALTGAGVSRVGFEDPGYSGTVAAAAAKAGVEAVPVPVDESGLNVTALAATGARAVVLTPAHQWPTGVVLSPERRLQLVGWAASGDATIIEDDYDAEFRYDRDPVGAVQGLAPERVAAIGTVSKSLAPSLRLGWVACPPRLVAAVAEQKAGQDRGSPVLDQLALAALIESGRFDRHLRKMRALYSGRRAALLEALAAHAPDVVVTGLAAGFHAVAHLPQGLAEREAVAAARERSVGLYGMSDHRSSGSPVPGKLVLGFGNLSERAISAGIAAVGDVLRGCGKEN